MYREGRRRDTNILLVEDNAADAWLIREGLRETRSECRLLVVEDGQRAIEFLRREGDYADMPRPDLILLDLNLPTMSGGEVLAEVKSDASLKSIPIVVLTSSRAESDINSSYAYGANSYIRKPYNLDEVYELVRTIEHYWLDVSLLPTPEAAPPLS